MMSAVMLNVVMLSVVAPFNTCIRPNGTQHNYIQNNDTQHDDIQHNNK